MDEPDPLGTDDRQEGDRDARGPTEGPEMETILEELAEDLFAIRQRLQDIDANQHRELEASTRLESAWTDSARRISREIDTMRRELLDQRGAAANRSMFNAVIPWIDILTTLQSGLRPSRDAQTRKYLEAAADAMRMQLLSLGFVQFTVDSGAPFDASRMECTGYATGPRGQALAQTRPGYHDAAGVVRPAGVLIADPRAEAGPKREGTEL